MHSFEVIGGKKLTGEIIPQGAKNEALQIISAVLLTPEKMTISNIPDILDVNVLIDLLGDAGQVAPAYRLEVTLYDNITSFGLRRDQAATQERRSLRARYQLVDLGNGLVVLDATAGSDASIDIVSSEYATVAAEQTALENLSGILADQIMSRLALYASRTTRK